MVLTAVASALSFYNATRFSERSNELADDARFIAALESQRQSRASTMVAHDEQVALQCVSAEGTRDDALKAFSQRFGLVDLAKAVAAEQRRIALLPLFLYAPSTCSAYDALAASEYFASQAGGGVGQPDWRALLDESEATRNAEQFAVGATVLFAVVLVLATLAELATNLRSRRIWLLLGVVVALAASAAAYAAGSTRHGAGSVAPVVALIVVVLGTFFVVTRGRRSVDPGPDVPVEARRPRVARLVSTVPKRAIWWAEVLGAATVVVFALSALGLSQSAAKERDALGDADRYTLEAREALDIGQQGALLVLDYAVEHAWAETETADGSSSAGAVAGVAAGRNATTAVLGRWKTAKDEWDERLESRIRSAADGGWHTCLDAGMVLPWHRDDEAISGPLPVAIRTALRTDRSAPSDLVTHSSDGATRCEVHAAMSRAEAAGWSERSTRYTLALLVLGLAGFLFAFAADPDRSPWPRRWLLSSAIIGVVAGAGLTASAWLVGGRDQSFDAIDRSAAALARAQTATATWHCDAARTDAATAGAALASLATFDVVEANAQACREETEWLIAPWLPPAQLDGYRAAQLRAYQRDPDSASIVHNFGWSQILAALIDRDGRESKADALEAGLHLVRLATIADARTVAPWGCFNAALATYALGNIDAAKELYTDAVASARGDDSPGRSCPTTETAQPVLPPLMTLSALADLELLEDARAVTEIREILVNGSTPPSGPAPDLTGLRLTIAPTQIGLEGDPSRSLRDADMSIVWYYRQTSAEPWGIIINPSLATLVPGRHIGFWPTNQLMPGGQYRADVYVGGQRASITSAGTWWSQKKIDSREWRAVFLDDVGLMTVIPRDWDLVSRTPGVEVTFGDGDRSVSVRRTEGSDKAALKARLEAWSGETWGDDDQSDATFAFGGLQSIAVSPRANVLLGAGYQRYLGDPEANHSDQISGDSCPGTTLMMAIRADDALAETIWTAQNLMAYPPTIDPSTMRVVSPFRSDLFAIEFPEDWTGWECPGEFRATAPDATSNAIVQVAPWAGSLDDLHDATLETSSDSFDSFDLVSDESIELANHVPARRLIYTIESGGVPIRQTALIAALDGRAMYLFMSELLGSELTEADRSLILDHVELLAE